jgi:uncharacterized protein YcfJ
MNKRLFTLPLAAAAVAVLAGCVTVPTGPTVAVMPGPQKNLDQFRIDDAACRQYAQGVVGGPQAQAANDAAAANAVAGTAIGAAAGALIGAASGNAGQGAAIGAGSGLLFGSAAGSNVSGYSQYALQRNYDVAYAQCMYARGNQFPGRTTTRVVTPAYPPPNYPAPSLPPPNYPAPSGSYAVPTYPPPATPPPNTPPPRY